LVVLPEWGHQGLNAQSPLTYKSIDTILAELQAAKPPALVPFIPILDPDESAKRTLLMTPALHTWCYQKDASRGAQYKQNLRAFLGRFVKGGEIDNEDFMKTWRDDVWEFRVQFESRRKQKPHLDNTRIFGAFAVCDTFVAFHPARMRSEFGGKDDSKWDKQIDSVHAKWTALLGTLPRVHSRPFSNCVSFGYYDCRK
jgi:hypothetical protein